MRKGRSKQARLQPPAVRRMRFGVPADEIGVMDPDNSAEVRLAQAILLQAVWRGALIHARSATFKDAVMGLIVEAWGEGDNTMTGAQALAAAAEIRADLLARFPRGIDGTEVKQERGDHDA